MTARNQNFKVYRGNSAVLSVMLTMADGSAYDPTIPNITMRWRLSRTSHSPESEALSRKSDSDGISIIAGGVEIVLNSEDTDFIPGVYYHELKIWDGEDVDTAMTGFAIISGSIPMGDNLTPGSTSTKLMGTAPTRSP